MPKRKKNTTSGQWVLVQKLIESVKRLDPVGAEKARSMVAWHSEHGSLTQKQTAFAKNLIYKASGKRERDKAEHQKKLVRFLYAISDGVAIKLGYSKNPMARLKEMQVGQATPLALLWQAAAGTSGAEAALHERKLHRFCKEFHKRGEWYGMGCMDLVKQFEVRVREKEDELPTAQIGGLSILNEARERIG